MKGAYILSIMVVAQETDSICNGSYHENTLRLGECILFSVVGQGLNLQWNFSGLNAAKITTSLREKGEKTFTRLTSKEIGTIDVEIVLVELSYASGISLHSQIDVIVYWETSVWKI